MEAISGRATSGVPDLSSSQHPERLQQRPHDQLMRASSDHSLASTFVKNSARDPEDCGAAGGGGVSARDGLTNSSLPTFALSSFSASPSPRNDNVDDAELLTARAAAQPEVAPISRLVTPGDLSRPRRDEVVNIGPAILERNREEEVWRSTECSGGGGRGGRGGRGGAAGIYGSASTMDTNGIAHHIDDDEMMRLSPEIPLSLDHQTTAPLPASVTVRTEEQQIPKQLADTLETIIKQMDVLTQTVGILEQRLTMTENKLQEVVANQRTIIANNNNSSSQL